MKIGYLMQAGVPDVRRRPLSGPANHVKKVFDELKNLGHQLRLLAFKDRQIWKSDDLEVFEPVRVKFFDNLLVKNFESAVRRVQYELQLPYAAMFESLRFAQACRQELAGFDLFYERMGWVGYGGGLAARWLGVPLVFEVNGDHLHEMELLGNAPRGAQRWLSTMLMQMGVNQASFIIATGDGWRTKMIERWDVKPEKVEVIENGSEVVNLLKREQLRAFQNSTSRSEPVTVIYIGGFEAWHGVEILIRAIAQAINKGVMLRLVLVGGGTKQKDIERMVLELNLQNQVVFTGYLPIQECATHLANADIGVSPYCGRVEFSGLKLLDYKSAGLAIIASGDEGQPSVIRHSSTGWIVPPCDEDALCDAIIQIASDNSLRKRFGREVRVEAERTHSWHHTAEQLNQVFNKILES